MHTNTTYVHQLPASEQHKCVSNPLEVREHDDIYKMQNSSPDSDPAGTSILYNDSGYLTNANPEPLSYSSNSNSEPSFEASEEISLHSLKQGELHSNGNSIYFCEDAVFDEPKLEGPPLLCDNTNNYEEFSSLIKFSLEEGCGSYLTNNVQTTMQQDINYCNKTETCSSVSKCNSTLMQYDNLSLTIESNELNDNSNELNDSELKNSSGTISIIKDICISQSELIEYNHNSNTTIISSTSEETDWDGPVIQDIDNTHFANDYTNQTIETIKDIDNSNVVTLVNSDWNSSNSSTTLEFRGFPREQPENATNKFAALKNENSKTILLSKTEARLSESNLNINKNISCNDNPDNLKVCTPEKNLMVAELSPELFSDDDDIDDDVDDDDDAVVDDTRQQRDMSYNVCNISQTQLSVSQNDEFIRNDRTLLKRVQENLSGVPPPPSVTILQVSVSEMLDKIRKNNDLFVTSTCKNDEKMRNKSLLIVSSKDEAEGRKWPEILNCRFHGLQ